jgi:hypothetical protein
LEYNKLENVKKSAEVSLKNVPDSRFILPLRAPCGLKTDGLSLVSQGANRVANEGCIEEKLLMESSELSNTEKGSISILDRQIII